MEAGDYSTAPIFCFIIYKNTWTPACGQVLYISIGIDTISKCICSCEWVCLFPCHVRTSLKTIIRSIGCFQLFSIFVAMIGNQNGPIQDSTSVQECCTPKMYFWGFSQQQLDVLGRRFGQIALNVATSPIDLRHVLMWISILVTCYEYDLCRVLKRPGLSTGYKEQSGLTLTAGILLKELFLTLGSHVT